MNIIHKMTLHRYVPKCIDMFQNTINMLHKVDRMTCYIDMFKNTINMFKKPEIKTCYIDMFQNTINYIKPKIITK